MLKTKKRSASKRRSSSTQTDERTRALKALAMAKQFASAFAPFKTATGILTDDSTEHDDVLQAIEQIAQSHFGGGLDFDLAFDERFGQEIKRLDKREQELYSLHVAEYHAQQLAGFALGVAWGRLQGGAR